MEIVGRHHDPFTVMEQFARPIAHRRVFAAGHRRRRRAARARRRVRWPPTTGWSFSAFRCRPRPRTCWRVIWRSRRRARPSPRWPTRSPRSIWRTPPITRTSRRRSGCRCTCSRCGGVSTTPRRRRSAFLAPRRSAVTLSNFYGGLIAAVITPVAVAAYWLVTCRRDAAIDAPAGRSPSASLVLIAAAGMAYASYAAGAVVANRAAFAFPRADLFRYSAKWWSYLVPPVEHPLLGATARRVWTAAGVREGLLEQQVSLGWGIVALGLVAVVGVARVRGAASTELAVARVPVLVVVAVAALVCSLSPERTIGPFTFVRPSALLYDVVPMFRSYARFGVVVQLMAALLAGIGVDCLRRAGTRRARIVVRRARGARRRRVRRLAVGAVARRAADDGAPLGDAAGRSRAGARLRAARPGVRVGSVADRRSRDAARRRDRATARSRTCRRSLRRRVTRICSCGATPPTGRWFADHPAPDGLRVAARFADGRVFAVTAPTPADLYGGDDGVLSARARRGAGRGDGWEPMRRGRS